MADTRMRKRQKKTREDVGHEKPTKEEIAIAKHLRFQLPTKQTTFMQENVEYFTGSKAVDFLLESKWATDKKGTEVLFTTRSSIVAYLNRLMQKRMFYRTTKTVKRKRDKDAKSIKDKEVKEKEKEKDSKQRDKELKKKEKEKDSKMKDKDTKKKDSESEKKAKKQEKKKEQDKEEEEEDETNEKETKKGKKKVVLEFAERQDFKDNLDAYVWVYDPIRTSHYLLGFTLVIAAIGICIYPLWPPEIKIGTYYVSLIGAGCIGSILVLGIFRFILFTCLWATTAGKLHFWLLPNLLEDVGVRESFQPLYAKEWHSGDKNDDQNDNDKDSEKDDNINALEDAETQEENDEEKVSDSKNEESQNSESAGEEGNGSEGEGEESEVQNDFEVIEKDEISAVEE